MKIPGYELIEILGQGGMGVVWLARELDTGLLRALKTVRLPEPRLLATVRHELSFLRDLNHPGVVRILDHGVADGVPWYAMTLVQGPTLQSLLHDTEIDGHSVWLADTLAASIEPTDFDAQGRSAHVEQGLAVLGEVCRTLSWLHAQGVVHLDLKPSNIIVTDTGPVILDFGLAMHAAGGLTRQNPTERKGSWGTPQYMAPEQINGEAVDARTDMYAVGCMLFEILSGAPPFLGALLQIYTGHLRHTPPPLPSDTDEEHAELTWMLLRKNPVDRLGYADVAARALGVEVATTSYVFPPELVGREHSLETARQWLSGQGLRLALLGEAGVGKTELARAVVREAVRGGWEVIVCQAQKHTELPFSALTPLAESAADLCAAGDATILGEDAPVLAQLLPPLRAWATPEPAASMKHAVATVVRLVARLAQAHERLLVLLDDAQWAGPETLDALKHSGVRVLATSRRKIADFESLSLDRLEAHQTGALITSMMGGTSAPDDWVDALHIRSEGNPFFVAEFLRAAVAGGQLQRGGQGWAVLTPASEAPLAPTRGVQDIVEGRLAELDPEALDAVLMASTFGRRVEPEILEMTAPVPLVTLVNSRLLALGGTQVEFVHGLIHEAVYESMGAQERASRHLKCGGVLRGRQGAEVELARHLDLGRDPGAAAAYLEALGTPALAMDMNLCVELSSRALSLATDAGLRISLADKLGRARLAQGDFEKLGEASDTAIEAAAQAPEADRARAFVLRGWAEIVSGRVEEALATATGVKPCSNAEIETSRLRLASRAAQQLGQLELAVKMANRGVEVARELGEIALGKSLNQRALIEQDAGQYAEARRWYEKALSHLNGPASYQSRTSALMDMGLDSLFMGEHARAEDELREAIALQRQCGTSHALGWAMTFLGMLHHERSEYDKAHGAFDEAGRTTKITVLFSESRRACMLTETGPLSASIELQRRTLSSFERTGRKAYALLCRQHLTEALIITGDFDTAQTIDLTGSEPAELNYHRGLRSLVEHRWSAAGVRLDAVSESRHAEKKFSISARLSSLAACAWLLAGELDLRNASIQRARDAMAAMSSPYLDALLILAQGHDARPLFEDLGLTPDTLAMQLALALE